MGSNLSIHFRARQVRFVCVAQYHKFVSRGFTLCATHDTLYHQILSYNKEKPFNRKNQSQKPEKELQRRETEDMQQQQSAGSLSLNQTVL